jgi:RNA polymerase sigma-70 factor (ECF subfamily)
VADDDQTIMPRSTASLTAAMARGDEAAVDAFYRGYFDWLFAQARRASPRRDEASCLDIVQDAVLRIVRTVRRVETEGQFRVWMRLVVQTTALDHLRRERRRVRRETLLVVAAGSSAVEQMEAAADADQERSHRAWLVEEIAQFDPQLVRMIELRYEQRWTLARIAGALGLSIGTVDGRLRRAIDELRRRASETFNDARE